MERSEANDLREKAKLALSDILQHIQLLEVSFASKVLSAFRKVASEEGHLGFEGAAKVLRSLNLAAFVDGSDGGLLGKGEEWRRLWRLWTENDTVDEKLFLFLAWRGHRFCELWLKDIAHPLFLAIDLDHDAKVSWADLESLFRQGEKGVWSSSAEAEQNIDLMQLLDYHAVQDKVEGNKDPHRAIGFPSFLAWICDAQDMAALRRAAQARPMDCVLRFDRFLVFMRPQDLGACVDPKEEEDFDAVLGESPQELALKAAKVALQEARDARQAADAAQQAVTELARSQPGTPSSKEEPPSFGMAKAPQVPPGAAPAGRSPLVQSMIEEAPLADVPAPRPVTPRSNLVEAKIEEAPLADVPPPRPVTPRSNLVEAKIEEAVPEEAVRAARSVPPANVPSVGRMENSTQGSIEEEAPTEVPSPRGKKFDRKKSFKPTKKIHLSVTDVKCRGCGEVVKSDSNYCRHCGMPIKGRRSSTSLRVEKASTPSEQMRPRPVPNPRYCALDADTESLPMAQPGRNQGPEEEWEDEPSCSRCQRDFQPGANFCSNCGNKREKIQVASCATPRTPVSPSSLIRTTSLSSSPKSQTTASSPGGKITTTRKDGASGYAPTETVASSLALAPSSAPQWTKIRAESVDGGTPTATVGLDMTGSGKPNLYIKGVDANRDGIPDVLLSQGATILVQSSAPGLSGASVKSDGSTLQQPKPGSTAVKAGASAPVAAGSVGAAGTVGAAVGAVAVGAGKPKTLGQSQDADSESEWEEYEESEEEEGDFEDDPVVEPAPVQSKMAGASK